MVFVQSNVFFMEFTDTDTVAVTIISHLCDISDVTAMLLPVHLNSLNSAVLYVMFKPITPPESRCIAQMKSAPTRYNSSRHRVELVATSYASENLNPQLLYERSLYSLAIIIVHADLSSIQHELWKTSSSHNNVRSLE